MADVTDTDAAEHLVNQALAFFGGQLDVLVNNVGTNRRRQAEDATAEDFDMMMATNVRSALRLCQLCRPHLARSSAPSIIFNSSVAGGPLALWSGCVYGMTKAALNQLTRSLACEWARDGIRVNAVAPWFAATPLVRHALQDDGFRHGVLARTPLRRGPPSSRCPHQLKSGCMYAMTKASLNQLTKNLACEWAKDGIRVNAVAPWYTATHAAAAAALRADPQYEAVVLARTPIGRIGQPAEIAAVMAFLASPAAAYMTGQTLAVVGGHSVMGIYADAQGDAASSGARF